MIILGGASRTGKGLIAQELMKLVDTPYISVDPIKMALSRAVPCYRLNTNGTSIEVSEELWPFLSSLILNCIETGVNYIIEGEILPRHVNELTERHGIGVISCFVGYKDISIQEKVAQVRNNTGYPNDWTSDMTEPDLVSLLNEGVEFSKYLCSECKKYKVKYIDFSESFEIGKDQTLSYLSGGFHNKHGLGTRSSPQP